MMESALFARLAEHSIAGIPPDDVEAPRNGLKLGQLCGRGRVAQRGRGTNEERTDRHRPSLFHTMGGECSISVLAHLAGPEIELDQSQVSYSAKTVK